MILGTAKQANTEHHLSDADFKEDARLAKDAFGLHLEIGKKALIQSRLTRLLKRNKAASIAEYFASVRRAGSREREEFISALTTNVTQFFREAHHFEYLERDVIPPLVKRASEGRPVRVWSAGCSTGQEAYSLAAMLVSALPAATHKQIKILATDIDETVLRSAQRAEYPLDACQFSNERYRLMLMGRPARRQKDPGGTLVVRPELRERVEFQKVNLTQDWSIPDRFDVIMCRNVAIYFDQPTQSRLWERLARQLGPSGTLFIGHSERLHGPASQKLQNVGTTTYSTEASKSSRVSGTH